VTSYLLASTVSTPLWGKLGDLYGRKLFFQAAIVIFLVGSVLSGLSQNIGELIGFRAIQGLGAGGLIVGAQAIIGAVVAPRERGRYMGVMGSVFAVASVAGPLVGGFFTEQLTSRSPSLPSRCDPERCTSSTRSITRAPPFWASG
jgi:MFS family permease